VLRSVIGVYQMRLFADGRFTFHIATLVLLVGLLWLVWRNPNPAGDLIQITAAMAIQLIALMNGQHLRDRRDPAPPAVLGLRQWVEVLSRERGPTLTGLVTIPESTTPKQRSAVMELMREQVNGVGHVAHRSPADLLYYVRDSQDANVIDGSVFQLSLQAMSGGTARCRSISGLSNDPLPAGVTTDSGFGHDDLLGRFRSLFPDGIVYDVDNPASGKQLRSLDQQLAARILPTLLAGCDDGSNLVTVCDRRLTPIYRSGDLRLILILPADPGPDRIRLWLNILSAWCAHA
jgi:hypothetical protein